MGGLETVDMVGRPPLSCVARDKGSGSDLGHTNPSRPARKPSTKMYPRCPGITMLAFSFRARRSLFPRLAYKHSIPLPTICLMLAAAGWGPGAPLRSSPLATLARYLGTRLDPYHIHYLPVMNLKNLLDLLLIDPPRQMAAVTVGSGALERSISVRIQGVQG